MVGQGEDTTYSRMQIAARGTLSPRSISHCRIGTLAPRFEDRHSEKVFSIELGRNDTWICHGRQSRFRKLLIRQTKLDSQQANAELSWTAGMSRHICRHYASARHLRAVMCNYRALASSRTERLDLERPLKYSQGFELLIISTPSGGSGPRKLEKPFRSGVRQCATKGSSQ